MTEYVVSGNPDSRVLQRVARILNAGGLAAIPTDTSWSLVCSISSAGGIARLNKFIKPGAIRPLTVICASITQASALCEINTAAFRTIKPLIPGPYVFVLPSTRAATRDFDLKRAEIGVRIPDNAVALGLVETLGHPLLSLTAKRSMLEDYSDEAAFPEDELFAAGWELEELPDLELILDPG
ncbi:MAG: Sua5/YciO/YrdC/YwlC family protein, partial [Spirochaetes bacterium]|nr:Sua5/YciO/YrdC/YwlC family protein [Spirochaetota bacterium]